MRIETRKNKSGVTYRVVIPYKDIYGRTQRHTQGGFKTKKAAREYGIPKEAEIMSGATPSKNSITFNDVWNQWLKIGQDLAPTTLRLYKNTYKNHIQPIFGNMKVNKINFIQLQTFFRDRSHMSRSINSATKSTLSHLFKFALKAGYISKNPLNDVVITGVHPDKPNQYLTKEQFEIICDDVLSSDNVGEFQRNARYMYLLIGYYLGLRDGEILGLQFSDIDWDNHRVHIQRQLTHTGISESLKTASSNAILPICSTLYEELKLWRSQNPYNQIICKKDGSLFTKSGFTKYFINMRRRIGFDFHPHMLRHTFATNLYKAGIDIQTAAKLTRHSNIETLTDVYTHVQMDDIEKAIQTAFETKNQIKYT